MRSKEQEIEMLKKTALILSLLPITDSIKEISKKTGIPTSTIQRYLNNEELIKEVLKITNSKDSYEELSIRIKEWLKNSKKQEIDVEEKHHKTYIAFPKMKKGNF